MGTEPDIAALAVIIIGITLLGAIAYEIQRRREMAKEQAAAATARAASDLAEIRLAAAPAAAQ
jgi:spermidine/putrescine transport system permease protein